MTAPSFAQLAPEYVADWARMKLLPDRLGAVDKAAKRVADRRGRYEPVTAATRVPWSLIGLFHMREADFDFNGNLANGDPLTARTKHVPAGRPLEGSPPFTWEEAAIDALRYDRLDRVGLWPLEVIAYRSEGYNGFGPRNHGKKSGYLWGGSSIYDGGKYVRDGVWDGGFWDPQLGVLTVLRRMIDLGLAALDVPSLGLPATAPFDPRAIASDRRPEALQKALNRLLAGVPGFVPLVVDGSIGKLTRAAVRLFQARAGLDVDSAAGPLTWVAIDTALGRLGN